MLYKCTVYYIFSHGSMGPFLSVNNRSANLSDIVMQHALYLGDHVFATYFSTIQTHIELARH